MPKTKLADSIDREIKRWAMTEADKKIFKFPKQDSLGIILLIKLTRLI